MKTFFKITFWAIILIAGIAVLMWYRGQHSFLLKDVDLEISAPNIVSSGEDITYTIHYQNNTRVILKNAKLFFNNKKIQDMGDILPAQQGDVEYTERVVGEKGEHKANEVVLSYSPSNINSNFETKKTFDIEFGNPSIGLSISAPEKINSGQKVEYLIDYFNRSNQSFKNLELKVNFPDTFEPDNSDTVWHIDEIAPGEIKHLKVSGILKGNPGDTKIISAEISDLANAQYSIVIVGLPITIQQEYSNNQYKIIYKNNGSASLSNVSFSLILDSKVLDFEKIQVVSGSFDKFAHEAHWVPAGVKALSDIKSGDTGELIVNLAFSTKLPQGKNFTLSGNLTASNSEFTITKQAEFKIPTNITLQSEADYNGGASPPVAGEETYYKVYWRLLNSFNDATDVLVTAGLPDNITWKNVISVEKGDVYWNSEYKEVVWNLGDLPAQTGYDSPVYEAVFRIQLIPDKSQQSNIEILGESVLSAEDSFTGKSISAKSNAITIKN